MFFLTLVFGGNSAPREEAQADTRAKMGDIQRSISDYFPMITRGFVGDEKEDGAPEVAAVGWKHDVGSRREREEGLR